MAKQHIEGILSRTLKYDRDNCPEYNIWYMKIQNNPLAYRQTPADFIALTRNKNILIECKETNTDRFTFNRLTQKIDLEIFARANERNRSYVLVCFWDKRLKASDTYLIDITAFNRFCSGWHNMSITRKEANEHWNSHRVANANSLFVIRDIYD